MTRMEDDEALYQLLPQSIRDDPTIRSVTEALGPCLRALNAAIPNLLLISRLYLTAGLTLPVQLAPFARLAEFRGGLKPLNTYELEQLAWQWHVDFREAAQSDRALAGLIVNSISWHRIKGTPASLYQALELCGFRGIEIEEDGEGALWATYQLGFDSIRSLDDVRRIVEICTEMQPARCKLWRVYTADNDLRPAVWSGKPERSGWSYSLWSDVTGRGMEGVPGTDDEHLLIVSFGLKTTGRIEKLFDDLPRLFGLTASMHRVGHGAVITWSDAAWSDVIIQNSGIIAAQERFAAHAPVDPDTPRAAHGQTVLTRPEPVNPEDLRPLRLENVMSMSADPRHMWDGAWDDRLWLDAIRGQIYAKATASMRAFRMDRDGAQSWDESAGWSGLQSWGTAPLSLKITENIGGSE